jgi:hypothetical protein
MMRGAAPKSPLFLRHRCDRFPVPQWTPQARPWRIASPFTHKFRGGSVLQKTPEGGLTLSMLNCRGMGDSGRKGLLAMRWALLSGARSRG